MKKIVIKEHATDRIKERLPKFNTQSEFKKFIQSRKTLIVSCGAVGEPYKVNMNYNTIPITVVVIKSHTRINIVTAYINTKTKKGKYIKKKVKHDKYIRRSNQETK